MDSTEKYISLKIELQNLMLNRVKTCPVRKRLNTTVIDVKLKQVGGANVFK